MSAQFECCICEEFYSDKPNETIVVTECGHTYHNSCIQESLTRRQACPTCRRYVVAGSLRTIFGIDPTIIPRKLLITTVGDASSGKTALVNRFAGEPFNHRYKITMGVEFKYADIEVGALPVKITMQDTGGDYRFKAITPQYIRRSHGIIIVYDCTRVETLNSVDEWVEFVNQYAPNAEKVLVGCRADAEGCMCHTSKKTKPCRKPTREEIEDMATKHGLFHFTTSAKTAYCVDMVFRTLAHNIVDNDGLLRSLGNSDGPTLRLHEPGPEPKDDFFECCKRLWRKIWGWVTNSTEGDIVEDLEEPNSIQL